MKRTKKYCDKCNKEISLSNFQRHYNSCGRLKKQQKINEDWKQENGKYKCPECGKNYSKYGIGTHIWRKHTDQGKMFNPFQNIEKRSIWNKGLTKETDERVKKSGRTLSNNIKKGITIPTWLNKHHSEKSKNKISKSVTKYLEEHPDQVPYIINHSSKMSYPEKILYDNLIKSNILGWIYKFRNGIYEYDFAWPKLKIDVEVDGGTHKTEKVKKIDIRRDKFSRDNGWKIIRFTDFEIKHNLSDCINTIKKII